MSTREKLKPIDRLVAAMDRVTFSQGAAEWTNGYRAGKGTSVQTEEGNRLFEKEMAQWKAAGHDTDRFRRLALKLLREASRSPRTRKRKSNA